MNKEDRHERATESAATLGRAKRQATESRLRELALNLAVNAGGDGRMGVERDVLDNARRFYDFLTGDTERTEDDA